MGKRCENDEPKREPPRRERDGLLLFVWGLHWAQAETCGYSSREAEDFCRNETQADAERISCCKEVICFAFGISSITPCGGAAEVSLAPSGAETYGENLFSGLVTLNLLF